MLLPLESATLHKKEHYYFTSLGPKSEMFNNSIPAEARGEAKDYKKAVDCLSEHSKLKKNASMARQTFLAATPLAGETINNFITRLQKLAEHCDYEGERDNQVRDRAISFLKDKNLKSKLYREETLTLSKLMEIFSQYHDKEALILIPESQVNNLSSDPKQGGKCWRCDKVGHFAKDCRRSRDHKCGKCGHMGHFEVCCHWPSRIMDGTLAAGQVVVVETHEQNPVVEEEEEIQRNNVMYTT